MTEAAPAPTQEPTPSPAPAVTPTPEPSPASVSEPAPAPESLLGKDLVPEAPKELEAPKEPEPEPEPFSLEKVTLPENLIIPDEVKTELTEIATEHKLGADAASKLLALHAKVAKQANDAAMQAWYDTQRSWVDEVKADPEFAGEKLQQAQSVIAAALEEYGSPEVRQAFDLTGAGSNPHIFRTFYKMAKALSEGGAANGGNPPGGSQKTIAERFYPNHAKG